MRMALTPLQLQSLLRMLQQLSAALTVRMALAAAIPIENATAAASGPLTVRRSGRAVGWPGRSAEGCRAAGSRPCSPPRCGPPDGAKEIVSSCLDHLHAISLGPKVFLSPPRLRSSAIRSPLDTSSVESRTTDVSLELWYSAMDASPRVACQQRPEQQNDRLT